MFTRHKLSLHTWKMKDSVFDDVANADSSMDNDDGCTRFMVNTVTEHHRTCEEIDVPVLCLDDDDLEIDKDYKLFRDHHLTDDNSLLPPFEDDNAESETRNLNFNMVTNDANSSKRKKIAELETAVSAVPLVRNQVNIQASSSNMSEESTEDDEDETLWDVPLFRTLEVIKRDNEARKLAESMADDTSWDDVIQRDNKARKLSESAEADTLWDVPLVRAQEVIQRGNKARRFIESKVNTLREVPLVRTKEVIERDNVMSERMKKRVGETKALPVKRVHRVTEPKDLEEIQSYQGVCVAGTRKKNVEEVVDKDYMSYLTWLVDSLKHPTTEPVLSDIHPPDQETRKVSTKVKVELESWSDDDDIIEVSDSPFTDGETTPFVVSKSKIVIDLEKDSTEDESDSCVFRKELMHVLEKPYDEGELWLLSGQATVKKRVSRCRELRQGRESSYETSELGLSYLEKVCDFDKEYKLADGDDKARLELLRGFFFYLENISLPGAFKPWLPENRKKLGQREQRLQP